MDVDVDKSNRDATTHDALRSLPNTCGGSADGSCYAWRGAETPCIQRNPDAHYWRHQCHHGVVMWRPFTSVRSKANAHDCSKRARARFSRAPRSRQCVIYSRWRNCGRRAAAWCSDEMSRMSNIITNRRQASRHYANAPLHCCSCCAAQLQALKRRMRNTAAPVRRS